MGTGNGPRPVVHLSPYICLHCDIACNQPINRGLLSMNTDLLLHFDQTFENQNIML